MAGKPQHLKHCNFSEIKPRNGILTLYGYGINISVNCSHLTIRDGVGIDRRQARLPRVGHGLRRLVVVGSHGIVTLAALRWLADQKAAFIMLDRDGSVLASRGEARRKPTTTRCCSRSLAALGSTSVAKRGNVLAKNSTST
jgi:hypothetical protein